MFIYLTRFFTFLIDTSWDYCNLNDLPEPFVSIDLFDHIFWSFEGFPAKVEVHFSELFAVSYQDEIELVVTWFILLQNFKISRESRCGLVILSIAVKSSEDFYCERVNLYYP